MQTPNTKKLYSIPDNAVGSEGSNIYLGINRTINDPTRRGGGAALSPLQRLCNIAQRGIDNTLQSCLESIP